MREIDELREWGQQHKGWHLFDIQIAELADAIEQAIADRWMELPLDADGVPWHIGDYNESGDCVRAIGYKTIVYDFEENDCDWVHTRTHAKPVTVETLLREFVDEHERNAGSVAYDVGELIAEYAQRLALVDEWGDA